MWVRLAAWAWTLLFGVGCYDVRSASAGTTALCVTEDDAGAHDADPAALAAGPAFDSQVGVANIRIKSPR